MRGIAALALRVGVASNVLVASNLAAQQTAVIRGVVKTGGDVPLAGAAVQIVDRSDSTRTSATGEFVFERQPVGRHALRVRAIGYSPRIVDIVLADTGWNGTIELERIAQTLPGVDVTAPEKPPQFAGTTKYDDYFRRRKQGRGVYRSYEDFENTGAIDMLSALQGIPGVSVNTTVNLFGDTEYRFRIARCPGNPPNMAVYLNGSIVPGVSRSGRLSEFLRSVSIRNVLFFEFYRGASEIPGDIERGDNCSALLIWTK